MNAQVDPTEFAEKRVLVSGGTKGLGRATVDRFARTVRALPAEATPPADG